ncbi:hypothetical protein [Chromobacterium violaceum]|nr:hypothetical protein [Chromobacterium violaceum]
MAKILYAALSVIGGAVFVLSTLGAFGVGDFALYYGGSAQAWCRQAGGK